MCGLPPSEFKFEQFKNFRTTGGPRQFMPAIKIRAFGLLHIYATFTYGFICENCSARRDAQEMAISQKLIFRTKITLVPPVHFLLNRVPIATWRGQRAQILDPIVANHIFLEK